MPAWASVTILLALFVLAVVGMWRGWLRRAERTGAELPELPAPPADPGPLLLGPVEATYVSTTTAGDWLDRITAADLGARSAASVSVHRQAVTIARRGAGDVVVPAAALRSVHAEPGIAGKVVGGHGILVLTWSLGDRAVDTGLRTRRRADHDQLANAALALLDGGQQ